MTEAVQLILVVDDDADLRELVAEYLRQSGFEVECAGDGMAMRELLRDRAVDLVILDLMLPGEDGLTLLRWMREQQSPPVIVISARGDEVDRVVGLELGADDYLPKPFGPRELLARIRAVLRRAGGTVATSDSRIVSFGPFRLNLSNHSLTRNQSEISLTAGEYNLLRVLAEHPNQVLSRDHLMSLLKGYERLPYDRSIDVRVTRLRRKIELRPESPIFLRTVWGEGYLFTPDGDSNP